VTDKKDDNWMLEALEEEERVEHGLSAIPPKNAEEAPGDANEPKGHGSK
jgi:hypothetical protein